MKQFMGILLFIAVCVAAGNSQESSAGSQPVFVIHGPTIVAFFAPVIGSELKNESDLNEVLSDYQLYYSQASAPLQKAGIDFPNTNTRLFRICIGKKVRRYRMSEIGVGYFFIAPGKEPHVEYGVMTDADLLDAARKYFGIAIR
jgi:hypothetical protein